MKKKNKLKKSALDSFNVILSESGHVGDIYDCILIQSGTTATANSYATVVGMQIPVKKNYTVPCLVDAAKNKLFEGVPAILRDEDKHLMGENSGVNSIIGHFRNTYWDPAINAIKGQFHFKQGEGAISQLKQKFAEAFQSGKNIGLSIVAWGDWTVEKIGNEFIATVDKITNVQSVDPCDAGNAGGKLVALIESQFTNNNLINNLNGDNMNTELKKKIFALCMGAMLLSEGATVESVEDDDLLDTFFQYAYTLMNSPTLTESVKNLLTEIQSPLELFQKRKSPVIAGLLTKPLLAATPAPGTPGGLITLAESQVANTEAQNFLNEAKKLICKTILKEKLAEARLPQPIKNMIQAQYKDKIFDGAEIDALLVQHQNVLAELNPSFVNNGGNDMRTGQDAVDKITKQLEWMLMSSNRRMRLSEAERKTFKDAGVDEKMYSIKEWYRQFTGDVNVTGRNIGNGLLSESIVTTGFTNALASTLNRLAVAEYKIISWDDWRKICSQIGGVNDFRNNERVRWGGYGNLPTVAQGGTYSALTSPTDEKGSFAVGKKGGTEDITLEAIKNDDVGLIASIAPRMAKAANITLYEFVFGLVTGNANIYDGNPLLHATHSNIIAAALSAPTYAQARNMLKSQKEKDSLKKLGIPPRYLLVSDGSVNEGTAYNLTTQAWNKANDKSDFHQTWGVEPIPVKNMTTDNDFVLVGDPNFVPTIEVGFLDGQEEPEIFTQDMPNVGTFFTNDKMTLKIRHIYGGLILDYRGFAGTYNL